MLTLNKKNIFRNGKEVYVIAEIGQNHQGSLEIAKEMILKAKEANANCVKFQKSFLEAKFTKSALNRKYESINSFGATYGQHKEFLEFNENQYKELKKFCDSNEIEFSASAMDEMSLKFLDSLNVPFIKIGSGDANNFPMLEKASELKCPLIISTGMQTMATVDRIVEIMATAKKDNFALLHCISSYPTAPIDCNLKMIKVLKDRYPEVIIGYSGHELGIEISLAAVLMGARIIERHFTLDKTLKGSDHQCSLIPQELKQLINEIKVLNEKDLLVNELSSEDIDRLFQSEDVRKALGSKENEKKVLACEINCKTKLGKSIVSAIDLKQGHIIQKKDIQIKVSEPNGIPAEDYDLVLASTLIRNVMQDCPIQMKDIQ